MPGQAIYSSAPGGPSGEPGIEVDALGLRCPLPALRLARAVREGGPGRYRLLADDPAASADIPALAGERGWRLIGQGPGWFELLAP